MVGNEKRLIDANALELPRYSNKIDDEFVQGYRYGKTDAILEIMALAPTVDAVEVVHGHWKEYSHSALVRWKDGEPIWADRSVFRCSRCDFGTIARHNWCPRCGADMRERKDNEQTDRLDRSENW